MPCGTKAFASLKQTPLLDAHAAPPVLAPPPRPDSAWYAISRHFFRLAASGLIPARWFAPAPPPQRRAATGRLRLEVVSHCWNYAHLLRYQLSSLVLHPPRQMDVRVTVFHALEDPATAALLAFFAEHKVPGVSWNWQVLPPSQLMRRCIGRNQAALATEADWVWFTDCDLVFGEGCLDALAEKLQGRTDALVYPQVEHCTSLLADDDARLAQGASELELASTPAEFKARTVSRATGPLQIAHGDVSRAVGYCDAIQAYKAGADHWRKCYEDRTYRWLLGTQGVPLDIPGVQRIRHISKGRYRAGGRMAALRQRIRQTKDRG